MPELPEVESALRGLAREVVGRTLTRLALLHPAFRKRITPAKLRSLAGASITRVERRGKYQLLHLSDGRLLIAHFRMNGDWEYGRSGEELPRFARAILDFTDGTRLLFMDSRALGTLELHASGDVDLGLGPDAADPAWMAAQLFESLKTRRGPIKPALLDQRLVAGLGNIYAAEALWRAKLDPRALSNSLSRAEVKRLRAAIAFVLDRASGSRYTDDDTVTLDVYDREGDPCHRCRKPVVRIVQAGRSTYFCAACQRA